MAWLTHGRASAARWRALPACLAAAALLLGADAARATNVGTNISNTSVGINDNTGVTDDILVELQTAGGGQHEIVVTDLGGLPLTPSGSCVQGAVTSEVVCTHPTAGTGIFQQVSAGLGTGNDRFDAGGVTGLGANVNGGVGNDNLTGTDTDAASAAAGAQVFDNLNGDAGEDRLNSGAGDDTLSGGADSDLLTPSPDGAQRLFGGDGVDAATYASYTDPVTLHIGGGAVSGSAADDTGTLRAKDQIEGDVEELRSGPGADTLIGDADPERFLPGNGADDVDGNGAIDILDYSARAAPVEVILGAAAGAGNEDTNTEVETLLGGLGADVLTGDGGPNQLEGGPGDDELHGAAGNDLLIGGFGADDHDGGPDADEASYRDRTDRVTVTVGAAGASGNIDDGAPGSRDLIRPNVERTTGSSDDDLLIGDGSSNELHGAGGADDVRGLGSNDVLAGGGGPDVIRGGGGGHDEVSYAGRARAVSVVLGGPAGSSGGREDGPLGSRDTVQGDVEDILGGSGGDTLVGSGVANLLDGGLGGDSLQGMGGTDTVTYAGRVPTITVTVGAGSGSGQSDEDPAIGGTQRDTIAVDVETVVGGDGNDTLNGADGPQTLIGGPGNDTLDGRRDADLLIGDIGTDAATYASSSSGVVATIGVPGGSGGTEDGPSGSRDTVSADIEKMIGSSNPDQLTGTANADELIGAVGDDTLTGLGGNDILGSSTNEVGDDTLNGNGGNDNMNGGVDNDILDGGGGADTMNGSSSSASDNPPTLPGDTVRYDTRTDAVQVHVDQGATSGGTIDESGGVRDTVANVETVLGGDGNDVIDRPAGGTSLSRFVGGEGMDTLTGGAGVDVIEGGPDADQIDGLSGADQLDGAAGGDTILGGLSNDALQGGGGGDSLDGGANNDSLTGGDGADDLHGGDNDDDLDGGVGADLLIGGLGSDLLDGGLGTDVASYEDRIDPAAAGVTAVIGAEGGSGNASDGAAGARDTIATDVEDLLGGAAGDTLIGNGAANTINGAGGADEVRGGHGIDDLRGGAANDDIFSRDASADGVSCQAGGGDRAEIDASDTAAPDCEIVVVG